MKIVAFAYACEPGKGSEPGAGWALVQMIASFADVHVITRSNNRAALEAGLAEVDTPGSISVSYVEGPRWALCLKRGQRGIRLYHSLWQKAALSEARRVHSADPFDAAWHLTIANVWLGSAAGRLGIPFIFGPVGGGVTPRWRLVRMLGAKALAFETLRLVTRTFWLRLNPLARDALRSARLILVQNEETKAWIGARYERKTAVFQNAVMEGEVPAVALEEPEPPVACFAGRLIAWKGPALAVRALAHTEGWRLVILGGGSGGPALVRLARRLGVADRVDVRGRVSKDELFRVFTEEASVFLFPSLHDDGPLAVAEAVSCGLPVVCLATGGPATIAADRAVTVDPSGPPSRVVSELAAGLDRARGLGRSTTETARFSVPVRAAELRTVVAEALGLQD